MQAINKGLKKVEQELTISEHGGPVAETFHKHYEFESSVDGQSKGKPGYNSKRESNQISNSQTKLGKTWRQWCLIPRARMAVAADYDPAVEARGPIPPIRTEATIHRARRTDVRSCS